MVAVDARHVGELRPFFSARVTGEVVERMAERGGLTDGERARSVRVVAATPVRRHRLRVVIELEREDWMTGRDQLVIDFLAVVAEVASETAGGAGGERAKVGHAARDRLLVR